jgi:hypothetical protein
VSLCQCRSVTETEVNSNRKEVIALGCYVYDDKKSNIKFEINGNQMKLKVI